jgi:hypothetical protein
MRLAGLGGSVLCSAAMIAAAVGLITTTTSTGTAAHRLSTQSMPGMDTPAAGTTGGGALPAWLAAWLGALVRYGPQLLVASLALLAVGTALHRRAALAPTVAAGVILYVGMYRQRSLPWMYVAIGIGTVLLAAAYAVSLRQPAVRGGHVAPKASRLRPAGTGHADAAGDDEATRS